MLSDQKDLLAIFNAHRVRYLIVGAHAVGVHSEPRGTKDLDVLIEASSTNAQAVSASLAEFGAPLAGMSPADFNDKPGSVFQIGVTQDGGKRRAISARYNCREAGVVQW